MELREAHKKTEASLNDLTKLLYKFASQMAINNQPPPSSNPFPSQPLPNPKGGINMVRTATGEISDSEDEYEEAKEDDMDEVAEMANEKEVSSPDKAEEFLIATIYGENEEKSEELPEKCADLGPAL
ncbi:hypothetical protein PIB30_079642 [Stylosanthes scabra]|uniref:Uncharacterized protein n=1 Tax=Stylosanthes scabra TaxID=79078 RepID=A0ABU6YNT0_9FABA|nr:hypothetical protein [Stylosanthes scabra]